MGDVIKLERKGGTKPVPAEVIEELVRLIDRAVEKDRAQRLRLVTINRWNWKPA